MIDGNASPYRVSGPMTYETAAALLTRGKTLLNNGPQVFDLAEVTAADSSALAVLLGWQRAASQGHLQLANLPANIRSLAELYGVAELLPIASTAS